MNNSNLLTIPQFAKMVGLSKQAIYKRLSTKDNQLSTYIQLVDNRKMLKIEALKLFDGQLVEQPSQPISQPDSIDTLQHIIKQNNELIELLKHELENKNQQIERLQMLLSQQQSLALIDKKGSSSEDTQEKDITAPLEQSEQPRRKRKPKRKAKRKPHTALFFKKQ